MDKTLVDEESDKRSLENDAVVDDAKEDLLSKAIGEFEKWQLLLFIILSVPCELSAAWVLLEIIFYAPKTQYRCLSRFNSSDAIMNGTCYSDCIQYNYDTEFPDSIVTQFALICERAWLANLAQSVLTFGMLFGSIVFGFLADRYGRRKSLIAASMMHLLLNLILPFCPGYWSFAVIRFLIGITTAGLVIAFVIIMEVTGPNRREIAATVFRIPFLFAEIIMPLVAYYLRSWRALTLGLAGPNIIFLIYLFLLPESPRWLISMGRLEEACETMLKAAKINNLPTNNISEIVQVMAKESNKKNPQTKVSYIDLITNPAIRMKNLFSCVSWFVLGLSFYGGMQYIGKTSSNVFISIGVAGILQVPGILGSGYLTKYWGHRSVMVGFLLINSICSGLLALPDSWHYFKIVIGAVAVTCAAGAFSIMYVFTSELFPTVARNMAVGASSMMARIGSTVAPFVAGMSQGDWIPPLVFAVAPLVAAGACWSLPETKGKKLMDGLDAE